MQPERNTSDLSLNEPPQVNTTAHSHLTTDLTPTAAPHTTRHSFSRTFAREHGVKAAILAWYLAHQLQAKSKPLNEYKVTIDELASHYPYMSRGAIASVLTKMCNGDNPVLKVHQNNYFGFDRTSHYAFTHPKLNMEAGQDLISFNIDEAVKYEICGAVILSNLRTTIAELRADDPTYDWHRFAGCNMEKHLPFTRSTLNRSLKTLANANVIELKPPQGIDRAYSCRLKTSGGNNVKPDINTVKPEAPHE